jgi:hypothetical protein
MLRPGGIQMTLDRSTPLRRTPFKRRPLGQRDQVLTSTTPRRRKCVVCAEVFKPQRIGQKVCGPECAKVQGRRETEKQERQETRERKAKLKTRSDWMKDAQNAFNAYVRARDQAQPCICCGKPLKDSDIGGGFDCGHYRSVGSAPHLRFDERNAHGQTKQCNRYGAGRAVDYRIGLIQRIGLAAVEALEADNTPRHYTIDDLKAIKAEYRAKLRALRGKLYE